MHCEKCKIRVPTNRPVLVCSICQENKHYKCNNLSKNEAQEIITAGHMGLWTCRDCFESLFPTSNSGPESNNEYNVAVCSACNNLCSPTRYSLCDWCDKPCHDKCIKNVLGCVACCNDIIPGYNYDCYQLNNSLLSNNGRTFFAPYDHTAPANQIGNNLASDDEAPFWAEIAEQLNKCKYIEPKNISNPLSGELTIMSLNIRSLNKNITLIRENLELYNKFDILCFCETSCNTDTLPNGLSDITLDGFHKPFVQKPYRDSNKGGGLAIYVNHRVCEEADIESLDLGIDIEPRSNSTAPTCEYMFVKVNIPLGNTKNKKSYIIGNFYRSPSSNPANFLDKFDCILTKLERYKNKQIILVGDINIDISKYEYETNSQQLVDLASSNGFIQVINKPTRVTDHSATLIDHVYTNQIHDMLSCGVVTYDMSDHLGTYIKIGLQNHIGVAHNMNNFAQQFPKVNAENLEKFQGLLKQETWEDVLYEPNTQLKYDKFINVYTKHYDTAFPKPSNARRKHQRKNPKPWILPWLEDACNRKNELYYKFIKHPTTSNEIKYKKMKKFVDKHINKTKNKFYASYFEKHNSDSRKQWQMLNSLLNRNKTKTSTIKLQDCGGVNICKPVDVAQKFNDYFSTIAENLKVNIVNNDPSQNFQTWLKDPVPDSMYITPTHPDEINNTIGSLKLKTTSDTNIGALKAAAAVPGFNGIMSNIINSSFQRGIFPTQLKVAKVVPIHKTGKKTEISNYRPISLLSAFSKIFEKIMHSRLYNFLQQNNSLTDLQFGFRQKRSCEHALLVAQNELLHAINKKQIALLLLIDFSKAFDMVNHDILLQKLNHYGIRGIANDWFRSYLENREQYVSVGGQNSNKQKLKYSVPQGSILGPLLFIIYINDMPNINKLAKFILYADDANIIITGNTLAEISSIFAELSSALTNWVSHNELLLNAKKTNYMIFTRKRNLAYNTLIPKINGISIERKSVAKFLGVLVDDKLSWSQHIAAIKAKMSRYIGILYKLKKVLPLKARILTFNSLVQSHINYCSLVWGCTTKNKIDSIFSTQKKAMRAIMPGWVNCFYREGICPSHTKSTFTEYGMLTVQNVILKNILIFMYKICNNSSLLPPSVANTISTEAPTPQTSTDYNSEWYSQYNSTPYNASSFFKAPLLYTDITINSTELNEHSLNTYKNTVKRYLLSVQSSGDPEEWCTNNFKLTSMAGLRRSARLTAL